MLFASMKLLKSDSFLALSRSLLTIAYATAAPAAAPKRVPSIVVDTLSLRSGVAAGGVVCGTTGSETLLAGAAGGVGATEAALEEAISIGAALEAELTTLLLPWLS
jgi:hypothetical protein